MLFSVSIRKMYQGGKIVQIEWDVATVTAGDYAVCFEINEPNYLAWKNNEYRAPGGGFEAGEAPALALKKHMKKEIEEKVKEWANSDDPSAVEAREELFGKKGKSNKLEGAAIADIVFSFNNADLITALRTRGGHIAAQDFDAMRAEEDKINGLFQDFDKLTIPTDAFITFERDDAAEFAKEMKKTGRKLLGQEMEFATPSEPTDIIWENRHFTNRDYFFRQLWAFIVIGVLLAASVYVIYIISAFSAGMAAVFPPVDCDGVTTVYGDQLE